MSPASSGALEVEKYIGACLISQSRPKSSGGRDSGGGYYARIPEIYPGSYVNYDGRFRGNDRWAGGMPLISFANHQKRNRDNTNANSTKGEENNPLARLAVHTQGAPLILTKSFRRNKNHKKGFERVPKSVQSQTSVVDTISVTSDESSGSANSDNCLPRIIKPRKRRKKDRKPSLNQDDFSTDSASPDIELPILRTYTPFVFDPHTYGLVPERKSDDFNENETPQLHHSFEDVEESKDVDINGNQTLCQCRYCDPSGQIWDVDRNCYSPFLTTPRKFDFPNFDNLLSNYTSSRDEHCLVHRMSSVSLEGEKIDKTAPLPSGDLEVSTEIVTSLNGHRDIEIKFFSSSSADGVRAVPRSTDAICTKGACEGVNDRCRLVAEE